MGINPDVTVNHGSRSGKFALSGVDIHEAVEMVRDELGWPVDGLDFTVTSPGGSAQRGGDLPDGYELGAGDSLTFLARAGNKGRVLNINIKRAKNVNMTFSI